MIDKLRYDFKTWLVQPPYEGVIWLAWFYVIAACLYAGGGPFSGDLVWFDDRVRLVQILDWLNGQGWYDRTITRVNAPEGFHTIWSRVVDLPVAGIIALFQPLLGQMRAAMLAATLAPLVQVLLLFYAACYFAEPLIGRTRAALVILFVVFSSCINPEIFTLAGFHVGMIGHHAWYVLLTLTLFGAIAHLLTKSDTRSIIIAALSITGLLVVGIEALPLMAGAFALIALLGCTYNRPQLIFDALRLTGLGALGGFILVPANQPYGHWLSISFAEPSILGSYLILSAAVFFLGQYFIVQEFGGRKYHAFGITAILAAAIGAVLVHFFPQLLQGGTAALSPAERQLAAAEHFEAQSLWMVAQNIIDYLRMIIPPLVAASYAFYKIRDTRKQGEQTLTLYYLGLLTICFGMASNYSRYFHYVELTTIPLLLALLIEIADGMPKNQYRALKIFALYIVLGPLFYLFIPAANYHLNFTNGVLLYPAKLQTEDDACETREITAYLNQHYSADKNIMVPMYQSDRFLLHTKLHIFFLANFPSQDKFIPAKQFYETHSTKEAYKIVAQNKINLVAICTKAYHVNPQSTVTNQLMSRYMNFGQLLVTGQEPDWLMPVPMTGATPWLLFETVRD